MTCAVRRMGDVARCELRGMAAPPPSGWSRVGAAWAGGTGVPGAARGELADSSARPVVVAGTAGSCAGSPAALARVVAAAPVPASTTANATVNPKRQRLCERVAPSVRAEAGRCTECRGSATTDPDAQDRTQRLMVRLAARQCVRSAPSIPRIPSRARSAKSRTPARVPLAMQPAKPRGSAGATPPPLPQAPGWRRVRQE